MQNFAAPPIALVVFTDDDAQAVADNVAFKSLLTLEYHRRHHPNPITVERMSRWYLLWCLLPPPGPEADAIAAHWRNLPGSRAEKLILPEPYDTLADLVRDGGDPVAWIRDALAWLGIESPTPLACPISR